MIKTMCEKRMNQTRRRQGDKETIGVMRNIDKHCDVEYVEFGCDQNDDKT